MNDDIPIVDLPGVGETLAARLVEAGYTTLLSISACDARELSERAEIKPGVAQKIIAAARKNLNIGFETAQAVRERRRSVRMMTTGSSTLDGLLGGGVQTQAITEAHGPFGSGKSQLAFQLVVNATRPAEDGGFGGSAVFIDTENTFRPDRIGQICRERGLDEDDVLARIHVGRAYNSDHQLLLADEVKRLVSRLEDVGLVVVDSLTSHFRAEYAGRSMT